MIKTNCNKFVYEFMYPEFFVNGGVVNSKNVGIIVTKDCNLNCSYCYEHGKSNQQKANLNMIKRFIDMLITGDAGISNFANPNTCFGLTIELIGGEPFLEVELLDEIIKYFMTCAIKHKSPWLLHHKFFIGSNGTLIDTPRVAEFIAKYADDLNIGITIDGCKDLHDKCRVDSAGNGSYDRAVKGLQITRMADVGGQGKLTIAPDNLAMLTEGFKGLVDIGYKSISMNPVFEDVWSADLATQYYYQLKAIADLMLSDSKYKDVSVSVFNEHLYCKDKDDRNPCGGNGAMLVMDYDGVFYPCVRYSSISIGTNVGREPFRIGSVDDGYALLKADSDRLEYLKGIKRSTASSDKCNQCGINRGCVWCNGFNYEINGDPGKRTDFICLMHQAASLANVYYWNHLYKKSSIDKIFCMNLDESNALKIVSDTEYEMLKGLSNGKDFR